MALDKNSWGYVFRYGFLEIDQESSGVIADHMIGFTPLLQEAKLCFTSHEFKGQHGNLRYKCELNL